MLFLITDYFLDFSDISRNNSATEKNKKNNIKGKKNYETMHHILLGIVGVDVRFC